MMSMAKKIIEKVKKAVVKKVTKKVAKPEVVTKEIIVDNTCRDCGGSGLKSPYELCAPCEGHGKIS